MPEKNPFNPSFGKIPPIFIDRSEMADTVANGLLDSDSPYRTTVISGVRGVGKTALLTDICRKVANEKSWIVADVPSDGDMMDTVIQTVQTEADSKLKKALSTIEGFNLSVMGLGIGYPSKNSIPSYQILLEQLLKKMQLQNKNLLIAIDEVKVSRQLKHFASVYQIMLRKNYPVSLLMTGLPKNISELQNSDVLTFLLRSKRIDLPMLNTVNVRFSFKSAFLNAGKKTDDKALTKMTSLTGGYSYAFQLLGYLFWETGKKQITLSVIDTVLEEYKKELFRNAYTKIFEELSAVDREFLLAMARAGKESVQMKNICDALNKKPNYVSTYRRRLLDSGILQEAAYGYVNFSLPLFGEYLLEFHS